MVVPSPLVGVSSGDPGFRVRIHRGTREIGGTCIELACEGKRLVLDLGLPLDADSRRSDELLPPVPGLRDSDPSLLAAVLSHGHGDHWGLAPLLRADLPIVMGAAARRILVAAAPFVPRGDIPQRFLDETNQDPILRDRKTLTVGPFRVTPFLVDHSAYDAYALLIEAAGRRLFYTGDLRGHGRKGVLFERLLCNPPRRVDAMLMEGSSIGRLEEAARFPTEADVEMRLVERMRDPGLVAFSASAQNIDRMVTIFRASKRTGRTLVIDLYAAEVLAATENPAVPRANWPEVAIYVPHRQRVHIKRAGLFATLDRWKADRLFPVDLAARLSHTTMLFRTGMISDIDRLGSGAWCAARAIWSQWSGYLAQASGARLANEMRARGVPIEVIHTSGHADIYDLRRLAEAVAPRALVPIHTFSGDRYRDLFSDVVRRDDGEWWTV